MASGKNYDKAKEKVDIDKLYSVDESLGLISETKRAKFDETVELAVKLGIDPRQASQQIRGAKVLPHGVGKDIKVLVFAKGEKIKEAQDAGADFVGSNDLVDKIQNENWFDFDVAVATPDVMSDVGKLGKILGPRGLMPNPKTGTVTPNVGDAVADVKKGKISFRVDKYGIIHSTVGRVSFTPEKLAENATELLTTINRLKPSSAKGIYMKGISIASSMSPGIKVEGKF